MTAAVRKTRRISPFWLLPFIALCIGAILFFQIVKERGTSITITFTNGSGIVADKTQVRYQGLQIGVVKKVNFTDNMQKVEVIANINPEASSILRENTKFWLVQPNVSLAGISGLDSLVSAITSLFNRVMAIAKMNLLRKNKAPLPKFRLEIY